MNSINDLRGQKFGKRSVFAAAASRNGRARWKVRCDCGHVDEVFGSELRAGNAMMCRPCALDERRAAFAQGIAGQVFGLRTVIGAAQRKSRGLMFITVRCQCGFESDVRRDFLLSGQANACVSCANSTYRKPRTQKFVAENAHV